MGRQKVFGTVVEQKTKTLLMKTNDSRPKLPPNVAQKLRRIRRRARVLALLEGLASTGAVLIGAMLVAMLIDLAVGWLDPLARYTVTSLALGSVAVLCLLWCALPFIRRRTIVSTAREVDQNVPQLEERWSTVTELAQNNDAAEVRGSQAMIDKVGCEAELASQTFVYCEPLVFRIGGGVRVADFRQLLAGARSPSPLLAAGRQRFAD
jgi:hypothetical protein